MNPTQLSQNTADKFARFKDNQHELTLSYYNRLLDSAQKSDFRKSVFSGFRDALIHAISYNYPQHSDSIKAASIDPNTNQNDTLKEILLEIDLNILEEEYFRYIANNKSLWVKVLTTLTLGIANFVIISLSYGFVYDKTDKEHILRATMLYSLNQIISYN